MQAHTFVSKYRFKFTHILMWHKSMFPYVHLFDMQIKVLTMQNSAHEYEPRLVQNEPIIHWDCNV